MFANAGCPAQQLAGTCSPGFGKSGFRQVRIRQVRIRQVRFGKVRIQRASLLGRGVINAEATPNLIKRSCEVIGMGNHRTIKWKQSTCSRGEVCERLKQAVLKTAVPERVPGVRIPPSPPASLPIRERFSDSRQNAPIPGVFSIKSGTKWAVACTGGA
jgi:hypothetical protein